MVKHLINKLKTKAGNVFRKAVFLGTTFLLFGCPDPYIPQSPRAIVYANPNSGEAPLESRITLNGEDPDGDIAEYKLEIDEGANGSVEETIVQSTPIDITRTFSDGNVKIYGQCTDSTGLRGAKNAYITLSQPTPEPTPLPAKHITGRLESNEEDGVLKSGEVRAYVDTNNDGIAEDVLYDDGENFDFLVPYNSDVKIKGKINGGLGSYVRTVSFEDVIENKDVTVRAVPYPTFCTPEEFRQHMYEINCTNSKWDLDNLYKIKIFKHGNDGEFNDTQVTLISNKFKDANDIEKFVDGKELDSYIEVVDGIPPEPWEDNCIYVVPNNNIPGDNAGVTYRQKTTNKVVYKVRIEIDPAGIIPDTSNTVITHEGGHAFNAFDGEAIILEDGDTILKAYPNGAVPKIADEKAAKVVYENTYNAGESWNNILGMESW
ncbi:MAG: hypothetical protein PHQ66_02910 [Candidatus Nanoarchaeia archaeon]|nr:hypothetical protein [Candidatus Nanoarchaeia archaeon]MDD5357684.1 hypothetical protein [Candidatus Nanoarchaeia archaeon]MDD5588603.1 hypothetical protein [Candidatus Nanoarchaeia archaeon]